MLYYLKSVNNNKTFYLVRKTEFIVGRKDCDIIIENDSSISRTHAKLIIKQGKIGEVVTLTDLGSKYKTFRNELELQPNSETTLKVNDKIKFGGLSSLFILHQERFVTTATKLSSAQREALSKQLKLLKGEYTDNWGPTCTHLTLEQINLTVKVLQALLDNKPIVLPSYWSKYTENVLNKLPPPDINDYNNPPITEALLNQGEWRRNVNRKGIFKNKVFLFFSEQEKKPLELLIKQAGGTAISWQTNPVKLEDILESDEEYLLMLSTKPSDDKSYDAIIKDFAKKKYRTIPTQEIAMAIVYGSCEKNCNPSFARANVVFQPQPATSELSMQQPLAENTQTQNVPIKENKASLRSIPETLDVDMDVSPMKKKKFGIISENSSKTTEQQVKIQENGRNISKPISRNEDETQNSLDIAATTSKGSKTIKSTNESKPADVTKKLQSSSLIENPSTESRASKRKADDSDEDTKETNPFKKWTIKIPETVTSTEAAKIKDGPSNEPPSVAQSLKRKADEPKDSLFKETLKLRKTENANNDPFSSLQLNMNNTIFSSDNPFLIEKAEPNDLSLFRNSKTCDKKKNDSTWSYSNYATSANNTTWISKEEPAEYLENYVKREIDEEEQKFIDLFRDTFIVEVSELIMKPRSRFVDELDCSTASGGVNFKKFKKVKPLHPQKTMYEQEAFLKPKDEFEPVANDKIFDSDEESVGPSRRRKKTFDI